MDMEKLKTERRRRRRRRLPKEIIEEEILVRLPVKSVLRFRSVSKAWCCLFGSNRFIKIHLHLSAKKKLERGSFICGHGQLHHVSVESLLKESYEPALSEYISLEDGLVCMSSTPPPFPEELVVEMVLCCDGLVCIKTWKDGPFILWNPSTKISKELTIGRFESVCGCVTCVACGFGWDESSGAYKVCAYELLLGDPGHKIIEVYSSKTNSWKTVDMDNLWRSLEGYGLMSEEYFDISGEGMFVSGKVHWLGLGVLKRHIFWFDLKSEVFGVMELPNTCDHGALGEHEGSLCLASIDDGKRLDIWVMKELDGWSHLVAVVTLVPDCYGLPYNFKGPFSFVVPPNGHIWLCYKWGYIYAYDPKLGLVLPGKYCFSPRFYIQSLVRP